MKERIVFAHLVKTVQIQTTWKVLRKKFAGKKINILNIEKGNNILCIGPLQILTWEKNQFRYKPQERKDNGQNNLKFRRF